MKMRQQKKKEWVARSNYCRKSRPGPAQKQVKLCDVDEAKKEDEEVGGPHEIFARRRVGQRNQVMLCAIYAPRVRCKNVVDISYVFFMQILDESFAMYQISKSYTSRYLD